ncbi:MAG: class I SAM-dependent methyltransferase [Candidatus Freyarchaeota archaeon]
MNKDFVLKRFNSLAPSYDDYVLRVGGYSETIERIIELAEPEKSDTVLDLGTGTGALSLRLAPKVRRVIARDISEQMLKVAREKAQKKNVKNIDFDFGSFSEPNCGEKVDIIVSNLAFHHLTDEEKRKAIRVWYGLLKPGGRVILGDHIWFFDPRKDPERKERIIREIVKRLGDPNKPVEKQIEEVKKRDHPSYVHDLKKFFEEAGFKVERIEETAPQVMGIISARKPTQ